MTTLSCVNTVQSACRDRVEVVKPRTYFTAQNAEIGELKWLPVLKKNLKRQITITIQQNSLLTFTMATFPKWLWHVGSFTTIL